LTSLEEGRGLGRKARNGRGKDLKRVTSFKRSIGVSRKRGEAQMKGEVVGLTSLTANRRGKKLQESAIGRGGG